MSVVFSLCAHIPLFEIKIKMCKIYITFQILEIFSVTGVTSAQDFGKVNSGNTLQELQ